MAAPRKMQLDITHVLVILLIGKHVQGQSEVSPCKPNSPDLSDKMDHARVIIDYSSTEKQNTNLSVELFTQSEECYSCSLQKTATIINNSTCQILLDTRWKMRLQILRMKDSTVYESCSEKSLSMHFQEYGIYTIYVVLKSDQNVITCSHVLMNDPDDTNIPIYVAIGSFAGAAILWILVKYCYRHRREYLNRILIKTGAENLIDPNAYTSQDLGIMQTNINPVDNEENKPRKERLKSLDTFRGISIIIMIFVNYGGGGYWFFRHSVWNGLTVADLVFPWFVWIMGTAMAYSFDSQLRQGTPKYRMFWKILKRSMILFCLGLLINSGGCDAVELKALRIPGVLQRFALTYLITATMHMFFVRLADVNMHEYWSKVRDILDYWPEWILNFIFLGIHIGITFGMSVPGCKKGYIGPGGLEGNGEVDTVNCTGGAAGYIDKKVFGEAHIYHSPTCKEIYKTKVPYDPEGLLGTLTSCFLCFLGLQAGKILKKFKDPQSRVIRFVVWGSLLCLIAGILCHFQKDGGWIPINKNLWSVSFVLCLGGFAFYLLTFCYLTIDVWNVWSGTPFYYPGMNAIALYMGHEIIHKRFPVTFQTSNVHASLFPMDIWGTAFWTIIAYIMFKKNIFVSV